MRSFNRFYRSVVYSWRDWLVNRMQWRVRRGQIGGCDCVSISPFVRPIGINVDATGRILIADFDSQRIIRFSASFAFDGWLGISQDNPGQAPSHWRFDRPRAVRGDGPGGFARPHGIEFDAAGNILVTELDNRRVQVLSEDGAFLKFVPTDDVIPPVPLIGPTTGRLDRAGNLYVSDFRGNAIHRYDADGRFVGWYGDNGVDQDSVGFHHTGTPIQSARPCGFFKPHVARVDREGFLVVADTWNHRITRFDTNGRFAGWIGADVNGNPAKTWRNDGTAAESSSPGGLSAPVAIDFDDRASILVAEFGNHRIQRFAPDGRFKGWLGARRDGGIASPWAQDGISRSSAALGGFKHPYDIAFHGGMLYVADTENGRVQIINLPDPTGST